MAASSAETHYATLGLVPGASAEEVERAFRRRAFETHPDHNRADPAAAARFRAIRAAYEVLRDPARRARYDAALAAQQRRQAGREAARRAAPPPARIVIRRGSPAASRLSAGSLVGLVQFVLTVAFVVVFIPSFSLRRPVGVVAVAGLLLSLVVWWGVPRLQRWLARRPVRATPGAPLVELDAQGLRDHRRDVRLDWRDVRGYVVSWPEEWMDLTLVPEAAERLRPSGVVEQRQGRPVYRLDLRGTDGELVDVEKLLQHVLRRAR